MAGLTVTPVEIAREVSEGDDIAGMIAEGARLAGGDVVVVSQKIVSKQEGRIVRLADVTPGVVAEGLAAEYGRDARVIELVLSEAERIVRMRGGVIITETRRGLVCANSGVDESNVAEGYAALLPEDPDASAARIRAALAERCGADIAVVISDTFGRPFRMGQTDCAIGSAGIAPILDYAGKRDSFGRTLRVTAIAVADEVCAAAELVMGKARRCPAAVVRGVCYEPSDGGSSPLLRDRESDLFR